MRIVIIGAGEVGFHDAKALSQEDHDITVVDIDPRLVCVELEHAVVVLTDRPCCVDRLPAVRARLHLDRGWPLARPYARG